MKVLFATRKFNPRNPVPSTHVEYYFYSALVNNGFSVETVGPFIDYHYSFEVIIHKIYRRLTGMRFVKYPFSSVYRISKEVNRAEKLLNPDLVFAVVTPPFVFYDGQAPCILRGDSFTLSNQQQFPTFGDLALACMVWQEKRVCKKCVRIITHSNWSKAGLVKSYGVPSEKVEILPLGAPIANSEIPESLWVKESKNLTSPYRLLFIGRDIYRKGLDIAIETVNILNARGISAELTVCGTQKEDLYHIRHANFMRENDPDQIAHVRFVGFLNKNNPEQMQCYVNLYRQAHVVIHPARFEPYGQFTSEAAAFGVPVITNDVGGLSSSVTDDSGIVLPRDSPPEAYATTITDLVQNPNKYYALCASAKSRYERELRWDIVGKRLAIIMKEVVDERRT